MTPDEYGQTIRELARRSAMPGDVAARMEEHLGRAFAPPVPATGAKDPALARRLQRRYGALAAAAALVIAVGGGLWYIRRPVTVNTVTGPVHLKVDATKDVHLKVDATKDGHLNVDATKAVQSHSRSVRLQADRKPAKKLPSVVQPAGFVAVPAAARLPRFESGVIVRMALPVTALPGYGVDISPASSGEPVEADVLVGQDGLPRAIRLVNPSRSQQ